MEKLALAIARYVNARPKLRAALIAAGIAVASQVSTDVLDWWTSLGDAASTVAP